MSKPDADTLIIGGGHNGLVAATYLARAGHKVSILERRPYVGGGAITEELWPGHFFSTCAHLLHGIPPKLDRDFRLQEQGLQVYHRDEPIHMQGDGTYYGPPEHDSERNRRGPGVRTQREMDEERAYEEFKTRLRSLFAPYRLGPFPDRDAFLSKLSADDRKVFDLATRHTIHQLQDHFMSSERSREANAIDGMAIGKDPIGLTLAFSSVADPYPDEGKPLFGFVKGGMGQVTALLEREARSAGVEIHLNCAVDRILTEKGQVVGVRLEAGDEIRCPRVLSNLDPKRTFLKLLDADAIDDNLRDGLENLNTKVSCMKLLAVISELPAWKHWDGPLERVYSGSVTLNASRKTVAASYDDIAAGRPPRTPLMSFNLPSYHDRTQAEGDNQTASVWIFPAGLQLDGQNWDDCRETVMDSVIDQIDAQAPNFRSSIVQAKLRTPLDLVRENAMTDGCIWHVQHNGESLFWNRPHPQLRNYRSPIKGLYLCGAGQHPGGEVTGIPGHNAAHLILEEVRSAQQ